MPRVFAEEEDLEAWEANRFLNHSLQFDHRTGTAAAELVQPANGTALSAISITRFGRIVVLNFNWTFQNTTGLVVPANGNVGNQTIAYVAPEPQHHGWWPIAPAGGSSGAAGRAATYGIGQTGGVDVATVAAGANIVDGEVFSCAITYATVGEFDESKRWLG